jgi:transcriptional regulator with XRE-family HTH domain
MAQKFPIDSEWFFAQLKAKGTSLRRFATDLGMDASAVSRMFNGQRNMSAEEQDRVAALLSVSLADIAAHRGKAAGGFGEMGQAGYEASGGPAKASRKEPAKDKNDPYRHPIFGCMKGTITIMPGVDLTESLVTDDDFDWSVYGDE